MPMINILPSLDFNKLTAEKFTERLKEANLVTKTDFNNELTSLNRKKLLQIKQIN